MESVNPSLSQRVTSASSGRKEWAPLTKGRRESYRDENPETSAIWRSTAGFGLARTYADEPDRAAELTRRTSQNTHLRDAIMFQPTARSSTDWLLTAAASERVSNIFFLSLTFTFGYSPRQQRPTCRARAQGLHSVLLRVFTATDDEFLDIEQFVFAWRSPEFIVMSPLTLPTFHTILVTMELRNKEATDHHNTTSWASSILTISVPHAS